MFNSDEEDRFLTNPINALLGLFHRLFPCENSMIEEFFLISEIQIACQQCGSSAVSSAESLRTVICSDCGRTSWLTRGTFFEGVKKIPPWFTAIWFRERGVALTSTALAKICNIAQSSAWVILRKIDWVLLELLEPEGSLAATSLFKSIFTRRSRLTPSGKHPAFEEVSADATSEPSGNLEERSNIPCAEVKSLDLGSTENCILDFLGDLNDTATCSFDEMKEALSLTAGELSASLSLLELEQKIEALPGLKFRLTSNCSRSTSQLCRSIGTDLGPEHVRFLRFAKNLHSGVSRKYLQLVIAGYWGVLKLNTLRPGFLFRSCLQTEIGRAHV